MSLRACFSLLVPLLLLGCDDSNTNNPSGSGGNGLPPPPPKIEWSAISTTDAPAPRYGHTAVSTGTKMLVWGGDIGGVPAAKTNTGGVYDPSTDTWKAMSTTGAPAARFAHVAVWTGSKILVWGGFGASSLEAAGGMYDPATDTWSPMSTMNQPPLRTQATAVWTGSKMVVWGGLSGTTPLASGGIYDPATDTWTTVNQAGAPSARFVHGAAWSGKLMLVWGGNNFSDWLTTGALFDPAGAPTGVWTQTTSTSGPPEARERHTLEFGGSSFVVWGGFNGGVTLNSGGIYDPAKNAWTATTTKNAPAARVNQAGVWAGTHLLVWGGCSDNTCPTGTVLDDGGQFVPTANGGIWYPIEAQAALEPRYSATAVYIGNSVIVWGGRLDPMTRTNTGARASL